MGILLNIDMTEWIKNIFIFNENSPLTFTVISFWIFFAVVLLCYSAVYKNRSVRNAYLFIISLFFYYKSSGMFFILLIFSTIVDYVIGLAIHKSHKVIKRKLLLTLSIIVNLSVLSYFKYAYFFTESYNQLFHTNLEVFNYLAYWSNVLNYTHFDVDMILLPVGISFFTFQTISYSIDVYKGKCQPVKNILDFGFYVSFFPQLVSGPIVRAAEFIPQLYQKYSLTKQQFGWALFMILRGLIKKMIIGDFISLNFIDRVFDNPVMYSGFEGLMSLYGYSLQVYCDFSGYTDIAIGVALIMGFRLPSNFNSPYKAQSVGEFWKRWHISLSSWLKDYLYIPLGGNRSGSIFSFVGAAGILGIIVVAPDFDPVNVILYLLICCYWILSFAHPQVKIFQLINIALLFSLSMYINDSDWFACALLFGLSLVSIFTFIFPKLRSFLTTDLNLMFTMLLGGLWHGAHMKFVLWGGLNGLGLIVYKLWKKVSPYEKSKLQIVRFWRILLTFNFITFTRIFFRADNMERANSLMHQIGTNFNAEMIPQVLITYWKVFFIMTIGFVLHWIPSSWKEEGKGMFIQSPFWVKGLIVIIIVLVISQLQTTGLQPFIYFQF